MDVLSFASLLETVIAEEDGDKRLTGNITSFDKAFSQEGLAALEHSFMGLFAYLAFFPGADAVVTSYVKSGTLASDSGANCLVMFSVDQTARWPTALRADAFDSWLTVDGTEHPSYTFVRALFPPGEVALPALVLFGSWTGPGDALAVRLDNLDSEDKVRAHLRTVFSIVEGTRNEADRESWLDKTAGQLAKKRLVYARAGGLSIRERLWAAKHFAADHFDQIVAVVGLAI